MDDAAMRSGTPTFEFVRQGLGHGPVTVMMPDGEILHGKYQITENAAIGMGISGTHTATAIAYGGGVPGDPVSNRERALALEVTQSLTHEFDPATSIRRMPHGWPAS